MPLMEGVEAAIIGALDATGVFVESGRWMGNIDELLTQPKRMPSAWVSYKSSVYGPREVLGVNRVTRDEQWNIILFASAQSGLAREQAGIYAAIAAVRAELTGLAIEESEMWPITDKRVDVINGVVLHELTFTISITG